MKGIAAGIAFVTFVSCSPKLNSAETNQYSLSPPAQVSASNPHNIHEEVVAAVAPDSSQHLIASSIMLLDDGWFRHSVVYASADGGTTWRRTLVVRESNFVGDPAVAFGLGGTAYASFMSIGDDKKLRHDRVLLYESRDYGVTWKFIRRFVIADRPWINVDTSVGSKYLGRLYVYGETDTRVRGALRNGVVTYFSDTPSRRVDVTRVWLPLSNDEFPTGDAATLSDGTYVHVYGKSNNPLTLSVMESPPPRTSQLNAIAAVSRDGGRSFKTAVIGPWYLCPTSNYDISLINVAGDASSSPYRGRLYATWADYASGRCRIVLSTSSDHGAHWTSPQIVDDSTSLKDDERRPNEFQPTIAVNSWGAVGVFWYDRSPDPLNFGYQPRVAMSLDGADTFLPSVALSAGSTFGLDRDLTLVSLVVGGGTHSVSSSGPLEVGLGIGAFDLKNGDTSALVNGGDGSFHAFWTDNSSGTAQIWTRAIFVDETAALRLRRRLKDLRDASRFVTLTFHELRYSANGHLVSGEANIENTSRHNLKGPFAVRVLSAVSSLPGTTAADCSPAVGKLAFLAGTAALAPGARMPAGTLSCHLAGPDPGRLNSGQMLLNNVGAMERFITLRIRIYARSIDPR